MSIQAPAPSNKMQNVRSQVTYSVDVSPEQNRYASILLVCAWTGICIMAITFVLYMMGSFNPMVEPSQMPLYWSMSVSQYAQATHAPTGWGWVKLINHGDYLNLIGLAFLGIVSIIGYLTLLIEYLRKKDLVYAVMVGLEIVVIVLAASGILHVGAA
ncbi:MAG: DUF1634 domain-containing protein [Bacillota bacterium]|nr:DUF1634 domain-containing protein [Bacillota bacterium]